MNHERAMLLVAALRSGKYEQVQGKLRAEWRTSKGFGFCCLGVGCDISGLGYWDGDDYVVGYDHHDTYLPEPVREWFGLHDNGGCFPVEDDNDQPNSLVDMNDGNWTFAQIADFIEQNWERL